MINIVDKRLCCGCAACVQICTKKCITFEEDDEGFRYPKVDPTRCIDCGLCEKVCPCLHPYGHKKPLVLLAARNENHMERLNSSSGGIFTLLAKQVISSGGVVFGARYDENWEVVHDYIVHTEDIIKLCGSKYSQSQIGNNYKFAHDFLQSGRQVLFSGTSCQIAGLLHFLRKPYPNLLTVEVLCHSVPSPLVWRKYLLEKAKSRKILDVNFRCKETGWSHGDYSLAITTKHNRQLIKGGGFYIKAMLYNLITRPSCSKCPSRFGGSGTDIILADCWGIWNQLSELDDNKGTSLIQIFTEKGKKILHSIQMESIPITLDPYILYNEGLQDSKPLHEQRSNFFEKLPACKSVDKLIRSYLPGGNETMLKRLRYRILSIFHH